MVSMWWASSRVMLGTVRAIIVGARAEMGRRLNSAQGMDGREMVRFKPPAGLSVFFFREVELLPHWHRRCVARVERP